jgi:DUF4097 and DUF4098 domain-containing protein YvlB
MKNKWLVASLLIVALIGVCAASLFAAWQGVRLVEDSGVRFRLGAQTVSAQATEEKTVQVSGPAELTVVNDFGDIRVEAGEDGKISVKAEKTAWGSDDADAQKALQELKVIYEQEGNSLKITVQQPEEVVAFAEVQRSGSVKFTISVPKTSTVNLDSAAGDLSLRGTSGKNDLQTAFGAVRITDLSGETRAKSSNGMITARDLVTDERVTLSSEFGDLTVDTLKGSSVSLASTNGGLDLNGVTASGLLKVTSEFGTVHLTGGQAGTVEIQATNGSVRLEGLEVAGKITVKSEFGDLILSKVSAAAYDLKSSNGKINLDGARGPIKASSEFGAVEVINAENAILDLSSKNGGVTFAGTLGAGPHVVKSEFGNITLTLPPDQALDLDLQTEFGKITSAFDITVTVKDKLDEKHWTGKINGGGAGLTVENNNGNITLQISK